MSHTGSDAATRRLSGGTYGIPRQRGALAPASVKPRDLDEELPGRRGWLRRYGLGLEIVLSLAAAVAVVGWAQPGPVVLVEVLVVLAVWVVGSFHAGLAVTSPMSRPLRFSVSAAMPPLALAAAGVGFLGMSADVVQLAVPAVLVAAVVSAVIRTLRWHLQGPVRVVVVGDRNGVAQAVARLWESVGSTVVGAVIVENDPAAGDVDVHLLGVPTAVGLDAAEGIIRGTRSDLVIVTPGGGFSSTDLKRLHRKVEHLPVAVGVLDVLDSVAPHRIRPGWVADATFIDVRSPRPSAWVRLVKNSADRLVALVALVALAPLLLSLMLLVKATSPGPALFRQTRVGRDGRPFSLFKLRTMRDGADEEKCHLCGDDTADSILFKIKSDPRVTRVGSFLRKYSLDELPQLLNVLKGDMSIVGPRPYLPEETARMDADALRRLAVRPGITGLWQVSGRSDLDWADTVRLDTYYADNWSLAGDLKILVLTVPAVLKGRGAY